MPNVNNINSPLVLLGNGRSGTTLLTNVFGRCDETQSIGETSNLIFGLYRSLETSLPFCGSGYTEESTRDVAADFVRRSFIDLFPSDKATWFTKPIMLPGAYNTFPSGESFYVWYWDVLSRIFPDSKVFFIIRNPFDVLVSYSKRWEWPVEKVVNQHQTLAELLCHKDSTVVAALRYEDLVADPRSTLEKMCKDLDFPFDERMLHAFSDIHAPNVLNAGGVGSLEEAKSRSFSHQGDWKKVAHLISNDYREVLEQLCDKYGLDNYDI